MREAKLPAAAPSYAGENPFRSHVGERWQAIARFAAERLPGGRALVVRAMARLIMRPPRRRYQLDLPPIEFPAADGVLLAGTIVPGRRDLPAVLLMHGWGDSMGQVAGCIPFLAGLGHTVLAFDFRAHGRSGGRLSGFGFWEQRDVAGALDLLAARGLLEHGAVAWGMSMGGVAAFVFAAGDPRIRAVVAEGCYDRLRDNIRFHAELLGGTAAMAEELVSHLSRRHAIDVETMDLVALAPALAGRPLLLVTSVTDPVIPMSLVRSVYDAAGEPKDLWVLPETRHARAWRTDPDGYSGRVERLLSSVEPR